MKRIWNKIGSSVKNGQFLKKSVDHVEKVEKGEAKVLAPKYPTEKKLDVSDSVRKELDTKHEALVDNMNKIKISSTDPVERWTSTKDLPSRESEWLHRNDPVWEYGFYEPPVERIPKDKLMFREALEYLRARQELDVNPNFQGAETRRKHASEVLESHPATSRVNSETLENIFEYFRPFERKDTQKVVKKADLAALQDHMQGYSDQRMLLDESIEFGKNMKKIGRNTQFFDEYQRLEEDEKEKVRKAIAQLRQEEHERLNKRLGEIGEMEKSAQEAKKKLAEEKENKSKSSD